MTDFTEVADRVWVARYAWADVTVAVVAGERGAVVVDTHGSTVAGRDVVDDVRRLAAGELLAVVNTHWHWDHCFGNAAFREAHPGVPIHAHEEAAATLAAEAAATQARWPEDDPRAAEVRATEIVLPDRTFSSVAVLDLGDRRVELVHPGAGHTSGDLVVVVPDSELVLAGDLVEESGPPAYGPDCWPLAWPQALDLLVGLLPPDGTVVPGHGAPVDRGFAERQRDLVGVVAQTIQELAGNGVPAADALAAGSWPMEERLLEHAVRRGYEQLPRGHRRLPLA